MNETVYRCCACGWQLSGAAPVELEGAEATQ